MTCGNHRRRQAKKAVPTLTQQESLPIWEERLLICESMHDCRVGDVCVPIESKHPGKASIQRGVKDIANECPLGHWPKILERCPSCTRAALVREGEVCIFCENKQRLGQ